MIRYRYSEYLKPPGPMVNVSVSSPNGRLAEQQPAQLDTAADRTVLPGPLVAALELVEDGRLKFQGFAGEVVLLPTFLVTIRVHDLPPMEVRAVLGEAEEHILLGRDVLNAYRILLDGPGLAMEIFRPLGSPEGG